MRLVVRASWQNLIVPLIALISLQWNLPAAGALMLFRDMRVQGTDMSCLYLPSDLEWDRLFLRPNRDFHTQLTKLLTATQINSPEARAMAQAKHAPQQHTPS